jgi:DNA polymerase-4
VPESVNWLFLDLNSYFASVEQQERPELRGRPVAVVPVMTDSTCCIAASYEAKAFGVRTGTMVREARQLCPSLKLVEARHKLYVEYHHKIIDAVDHCIPVTKVVSIDEMASRLMGRECTLPNALELATKIKLSIRKRAGDTLRCSIGLAPNRLLAKMASNVQKPDGLFAMTLEQLPRILYRLEPEDVPGIGRRMSRRLERQGIHTMEQLCALSSSQMRSLWGSVVGERYWHWLRGEDFEGQEKSPQRSVSHQHVLPPELRTRDKAGAVIQKLIFRAAARLRHMKMWANGFSVYAGFSVHQRGGWEAHTRIMGCQDAITLVEIFRKMWQDCPEGKPSFVGIALYDLVPDEGHTLSLLGEEDKRGRLFQAMDSIQAKYGGGAVYLGGFHQVRDAAPVRIAFTSIPDFD